MHLWSVLAWRAGTVEASETELSPELQALGATGHYTEVLGTRTIFFLCWSDTYNRGALVQAHRRRW